MVQQMVKQTADKKVGLSANQLVEMTVKLRAVHWVVTKVEMMVVTKVG